MKKKSMTGLVKKAALALSLSLVLGLCGCGETTEADTPSETSVAAESSQQAGTTVEAPVAESSAKLDSLMGDWEMVAYLSEDYVDVINDEETSSTISVFKEDGKYKMDYDMNSYESVEMYGVKLEEKTDKAYFTEVVAADWYAKVNTRSKNSEYAITSKEDGTLALQIRYTYGSDDETYTYDYFYIYVKSDASNKQEIIDSYRYDETVTVSTMKELYNAIGSRKRIILKAGTYNLSSLLHRDRKNSEINHYYDYDDGAEYDISGDSMYIPYLSHLSLEAEEGATVLICTEDSSVAPLEFYGCSDIVLKGITLGHEVVKGSCTGSVLILNSCSGVQIDDCNLYGCGTYAIEAAYTYNATVNNTDMYECTYGLLDVRDCGNWEFNRCKFRDSEEYTMLSLYGSYNLYFNDCSITNNTTDGNYFSFIGADDSSWIYFDHCTFRGNSYVTMCDGSVQMTNCVIDD